MSIQFCAEPAATPAAYLDRALGIFARAADRAGRRISKHFRIATSTVRLEFAGPSMVPHAARAFAHLEIPADSACGAPPDWTICVWDSASTATPLLRGWEPEDWGTRGEIPAFNNDRFCLLAQFEPKIIYMFDLERRLGLFWTEDAARLPSYEAGAPMRPLLFEWLLCRGSLPVHGAAVGYPNGGVLLAGKGGAGKSNAALACLQSDLFYAGDDFCALSENGCWNLHSLFSTGKVALADLTRLPHLRPFISNTELPDGEKALFFLNDRQPERLIFGFPLRAILLVRVVDSAESHIEPASPAEVHKVLAMSTLPLSPRKSASVFQSVARLTRALPCYELRMGSRCSEIPVRIDELLRTLLSSGSGA